MSDRINGNGYSTSSENLSVAACTDAREAGDIPEPTLDT